MRSPPQVPTNNSFPWFRSGAKWILSIRSIPLFVEPWRGLRRTPWMESLAGPSGKRRPATKPLQFGFWVLNRSKQPIVVFLLRSRRFLFCGETCVGDLRWLEFISRCRTQTPTQWVPLPFRRQLHFQIKCWKVRLCCSNGHRVLGGLYGNLVALAPA